MDVLLEFVAKAGGPVAGVLTFFLFLALMALIKTNGKLLGAYEKTIPDMTSAMRKTADAIETMANTSEERNTLQKDMSETIGAQSSAIETLKVVVQTNHSSNAENIREIKEELRRIAERLPRGRVA